jgi:hypothetical protein
MRLRVQKVGRPFAKSGNMNNWVKIARILLIIANSFVWSVTLILNYLKYLHAREQQSLFFCFCYPKSFADTLMGCPLLLLSVAITVAAVMFETVLLITHKLGAKQFALEAIILLIPSIIAVLLMATI